MATTRLHALPDDFQMIYRAADDNTFDSCFECGNDIRVKEKVYFTKDDGCPTCSLDCARARREQLEDIAEDKP